MIQNKTLVHVYIIAVIALVAYFGWWKRRCDTVSGSNSIYVEGRRQFPVQHYHRHRKDPPSISFGSGFAARGPLVVAPATVSLSFS